ncbi:MAG TPA: NUDIX domain-containing protein, partial [Thermoanaerobaculia bacterium]|nr:NUDIX domain-containing protein [Thermoanaerobaculia bacterium]
MARPRFSNVFGGGRHDRLEERREDAAFLAAALPHARVLLVAGEQVAVVEGAPPRALHLATSELAALAPGLAAPLESARLWLLGEHEGSVFFGAEAPDAAALAAVAAARGATVAPLKTVAALLPEGEAALLAHLRGLAAWHASSRYCGTCGAPTAATHAGHQRRCTASGCGAVLFPRTDVAVIAIVSRGDRALLVRQPGWRPQHFATIAGFLEPGEGLEGCLAREVREE